jgi:preprotein translocase subunit SecD
VQIPSIDLTLDYRTVTILFLPHQHETFERALEQASSTLTSDLERLHVSQREVFDEFRTALDKVRRNYDVRSSGAALAQMARVTLEAMGEDVEEREAVPVFDLLGTSTIPSEAAAVIDRAIGTMEQRGEITRTGRWRALELLCADYLAG